MLNLGNLTFEIIVVIIFFVILYFAFIIWLIKKGVKNAIEETLLENEFHEQLKLDIKFAIISAYKEIQYSENKEEPTE